MFKGLRVSAILLMSGSGNRFGSEIPKQFLSLGNKRVYLHTLEKLIAAEVFDEIVLVTHPEWISVVTTEAQGCQIITGGVTRQESSYLGLKALSEKPEIVFVHDAVRPFITREIILNNIEQALIHGAVDTCIPSADTLVYAPSGFEVDSIPIRAQYLRGQTPQTFRYEWLMNAHMTSHLLNATDDCSLVLESGYPIHIVHGDEQNIKITTKLDIKIAEIILNNNKLDKTM